MRSNDDSEHPKCVRVVLPRSAGGSVKACLSSDAVMMAKFRGWDLQAKPWRFRDVLPAGGSESHYGGPRRVGRRPHEAISLQKGRRSARARPASCQAASRKREAPKMQALVNMVAR